MTTQIFPSSHIWHKLKQSAFQCPTDQHRIFNKRNLFYTLLLLYILKTKNKKKVYKLFSSVCLCDRGLLAILLLNEWIWYSLHAILWTDEHYGGPSADHQPQLPGVFCQLQLVIWIWIDNDVQVLKTRTHTHTKKKLLKTGSLWNFSTPLAQLSTD